MIQPEDRDMKSGIMDRMRLWHDGIIGFIPKRNLMTELTTVVPGTINRFYKIYKVCYETKITDRKEV